jgi:dihydropteroate synthase
MRSSPRISIVVVEEKLPDAPRRPTTRDHGLMAPRVMGIVNVTPDSFSDGGSYLEPRAAIARGYELVAEGDVILDIGGE